jgi:hypothetical protein
MDYRSPALGRPQGAIFTVYAIRGKSGYAGGGFDRAALDAVGELLVGESGQFIQGLPRHWQTLTKINVSNIVVLSDGNNEISDSPSRRPLSCPN